MKISDENKDLETIKPHDKEGKGLKEALVDLFDSLAENEGFLDDEDDEDIDG